jgi:DNA-binding CsgD family transcriptional regulator
MRPGSIATLAKDRSSALEQGLACFRDRQWTAACAQFSAADKEAPLEPEHLILLAQSSLLIGRQAEGNDLLARAHQAFLAQGKTTFAVRCAFWLGFMALLNHEHARAGGWLGRAARLLEGCPECVERGYMMLPGAFRAFHSGDPATAYITFQQAGAVGRQFSDTDLMTLALQGQGRSLIRQGDMMHGLELLDEAMIAVTEGECSPLNAGGVYCSVLEACGEVFDLRRALEWTSELKKWCDAQPDIVPYRAACLVKRAELLQFCGAWAEALEEAERACHFLAEPAPRPGLWSALYQFGEIQRMRGNLEAAERAYEQAGQLHPEPGPGLARLRLAQEKVDAALAAVRRALENAVERAKRAVILDAFVEIALVAGESDAARRAAEELAQIASRLSVPYLHALSLRGEGLVMLEEGEARGALSRLRQAWTLLGEIPVPYEAARTRCMIAQACRKLGDEENARIELSAARTAFEELGAAADLACVNACLQQKAKLASCPLTDREREVLRLVAAGHTNRRIAESLFISEKTVARHLSNIFTKLDLESRTAATVYALEHKLL